MTLHTGYSYFTLLKKYARNGQLYVLINNGTLSQAEIFTLKLKKLNNVITTGQTTKGMLAYGSKISQTASEFAEDEEFKKLDPQGGGWEAI